MTDKADAPLTGEARLKAQRNRFWAFCGIGFAVAIVTGFATGMIGDMYREGDLPAAALVVLWGLCLAGFTWFTVSYFRRVDELDLMDNLWACIIGFYFYAVALPSWYLFHDFGLLGEPNQIIIYLATMIVTFVVYFARKLGLR